jgi:hypothetical protein
MLKPFAIALLFVSPALASEDSAPPAPTTPQAPGQFTPPIPPPGQATVALTEAQITQIVDSAVTKAMARQTSIPPLPTAQSAAAMASPQAFSQPAPVIQYATAPTTQQINVLVEKGPLHKALGKLGEHLMHKAEPKVKTMTIAPVATPTPAPTYTLTPAPPVAYTPPVAPTPSAPAAFTMPSPQSAPSKASPQR